MKVIETSALKAWLEQFLENTGYFLVELKNTQGRLLVTIDGDQLVPIGQCVTISKKLAGWLEEKIGADAGNFHLEVSSPGADAPLKLSRQFSKHLGRTVEVKLISGEFSTGVLLKKEEGEITLQERKKGSGKAFVSAERTIALNDIVELKVVIDFKGSKR